MARGKKTGGRDFKPGNNANPLGAPKLSPEVKALRSFNTAQIMEWIKRLGAMTVEELEQACQDKTLPPLEAWLYKAALTGIYTGDLGKLSVIWDRLIGKVPDKLQSDSNFTHRFAEMPDDLLMAKAEEAIALHRAKKTSS